MIFLTSWTLKGEHFFKVNNRIQYADAYFMPQSHCLEGDIHRLKS